MIIEITSMKEHCKKDQTHIASDSGSSSVITKIPKKDLEKFKTLTDEEYIDLTKPKYTNKYTEKKTETKKLIDEIELWLNNFDGDLSIKYREKHSKETFQGWAYQLLSLTLTKLTKP